ncbi:hypothetical protein BD560DRAFT_380502 [Blakeslea trispora]|nr:hypothetical protein BD560DRAFT_380502 [Blakeslea trispora]
MLKYRQAMLLKQHELNIQKEQHTEEEVVDKQLKAQEQTGLSIVYYSVNSETIGYGKTDCLSDNLSRE